MRKILILEKEAKDIMRTLKERKNHTTKEKPENKRTEKIEHARTFSGREK